MNIDKIWNILQIVAFFLVPLLFQMAMIKVDPSHCRREEISGDTVCNY
jgi:hypothetical protein